MLVYCCIDGCEVLVALRLMEQAEGHCASVELSAVTRHEGQAQEDSTLSGSANL